ncbi:MAG TPA: MazG nucleotide pyrophosphohydrolase domain-containing protein [Verrucomicrobiae bacterium]|nr:MazG nucleotide pyrophosphohydrolase domain-containing protein [Verrucomicrobiae bacterium]
MKQDPLHLPQKPSPQDFQKYVADMMAHRGFDSTDIMGQFLQFTEEVGELAKAIRKAEGRRFDRASHVGGVNEELADIFMYLLYFCNYFDIDLEQAFREKEAINKKRVWK